MCELDMVHNAYRSEVLLPGHVPGDVEQPSPAVEHGMRRDVPEPRRMMRSPGEKAARQYIAEREAKRALIQDIPRHTSSPAGQGGYAQYAGWRRIDGHALILLKTSEVEISVMPVDAATLARVKRMKVGVEVIFNADGMVRKKGRSL